MRLITFFHDGQVRLGVLVGGVGAESVLDLRQVLPGLPVEMTEFLEAGDAALAAAGPRSRRRARPIFCRWRR